MGGEGTAAAAAGAAGDLSYWWAAEAAAAAGLLPRRLPWLLVVLLGGASDLVACDGGGGGGRQARGAALSRGLLLASTPRAQRRRALPLASAPGQQAPPTQPRRSPWRALVSSALLPAGPPPPASLPGQGAPTSSSPIESAASSRSPSSPSSSSVRSVEAKVGYGACRAQVHRCAARHARRRARSGPLQRHARPQRARQQRCRRAARRAPSSEVSPSSPSPSLSSSSSCGGHQPCKTRGHAQFSWWRRGGTAHACGALTPRQSSTCSSSLGAMRRSARAQLWPMQPCISHLGCDDAQRLHVTVILPHLFQLRQRVRTHDQVGAGVRRRRQRDASRRTAADAGRRRLGTATPARHPPSTRLLRDLGLLPHDDGHVVRLRGQLLERGRRKGGHHEEGGGHRRRRRRRRRRLPSGAAGVQRLGLSLARRRLRKGSPADAGPRSESPVRPRARCGVGGKSTQSWGLPLGLGRAPAERLISHEMLDEPRHALMRSSATAAASRAEPPERVLPPVVPAQPVALLYVSLTFTLHQVQG